MHLFKATAHFTRQLAANGLIYANPKKFGPEMAFRPVIIFATAVSDE